MDKKGRARNRKSDSEIKLQVLRELKWCRDGDAGRNERVLVHLAERLHELATVIREVSKWQKVLMTASFGYYGGWFAALAEGAGPDADEGQP